MLTIKKARARAGVVAGAAALVAGGFAMLGSHSALAGYTNSCSAAGLSTVYTHSRVGAPVGAGVCVDSPVPGTVPGGDLEVGANASTGQAYVILDGQDGNPAVGPVGTSGYIGVSNYETGTKDPYAQDTGGACGDNGATAGGTNSGGAVMAKPLCQAYFTNVGSKTGTGYGLPLPIACGFNSGPDWDNTPRDGCFFP